MHGRFRDGEASQYLPRLLKVDAKEIPAYTDDAVKEAMNMICMPLLRLWVRWQQNLRPGLLFAVFAYARYESFVKGSCLPARCSTFHI